MIAEKNNAMSCVEIKRRVLYQTYEWTECGGYIGSNCLRIYFGASRMKYLHNLPWWIPHFVWRAVIY